MPARAHSRRNLFPILLSNIALGIPMPMFNLLGSSAGAALAPNSTFNTARVSVQTLFGMLVATAVWLSMSKRGRQKTSHLAQAQFPGWTDFHAAQCPQFGTINRAKSA